MKRVALLLSLCFLLVACASTMKYTPPKIEPLPKMASYVPPEDPFVNTEPPKPMFLKKDADGKWVECPKEEGTIIAYIPKEHDKIVLRLQYLKEMNSAMVKLINVYIDINNIRVELQMDERLAKEVYRQLWMETENKLSNEKLLSDIEKGGLAAVIVAQLIAIIALAL